MANRKLFSSSTGKTAKIDSIRSKKMCCSTVCQVDDGERGCGRTLDLPFTRKLQKEKTAMSVNLVCLNGGGKKDGIAIVSHLPIEKWNGREKSQRIAIIVVAGIVTYECVMLKRRFGRR